MKISKKQIAREILIFFSSGILILIIWLIIFIKNAYTFHLIDNYNNESQRLNTLNDELPTSYNWDLYQKMSVYFIDWYTIGVDTFCFTHNNLDGFLKEKPNAKLLKQPLDGFIDLMSINYKIYDNSSSFNINKSKFTNSPNNSLHEIIDPTIIANFNKVMKGYRDPEIGCFYITYYEFEENFKKGVYQYWVSKILNLATTRKEIDKGIGYNIKVLNEKIDNENKIAIYNSKSSNAQIDIIYNEQQRKIILIAVLILSMLIYPGRLAIIASIWAIKTIRTE